MMIARYSEHGAPEKRHTIVHHHKCLHQTLRQSQQDYQDEAKKIGIYPLRRSRRGGTAKVEEYAPGVSGMSEDISNAAHR